MGIIFAQLTNEMKVLLSLLFILHIFDVTAQISNVVTIDVENSVPINSPSVAINPKKSSNILISIDYNKVFVTQDSGASWTPKIIPPTNGVIKNSRLSVEKKGAMSYLGKFIRKEPNIRMLPQMPHYLH